MGGTWRSTKGRSDPARVTMEKRRRIDREESSPAHSHSRPDVHRARAPGLQQKEIEQLKTENKTLTEEKQRSQRELGAAGAATAEMQSTLDDVQRSLEDLRVKELKAVRTSIAVAQEGKTAAAQKRDELKAEIEEIRNSVK